TERELCDRAADPPLDPLRAKRDLLLSVALAPLLRPVRVSDGHAHDRDRRMDAAERCDSWNPPPCADDDPPADLLAKDPVRRADVIHALRRGRSGFEPESGLAYCGGSLADDGIRRRAAIPEREVEIPEIQ